MGCNTDCGRFEFVTDYTLEITWDKVTAKTAASDLSQETDPSQPPLFSIVLDADNEGTPYYFAKNVGGTAATLGGTKTYNIKLPDGNFKMTLGAKAQYARVKLYPTPSLANDFKPTPVELGMGVNGYNASIGNWWNDTTSTCPECTAFWDGCVHKNARDLLWTAGPKEVEATKEEAKKSPSSSPQQGGSGSTKPTTGAGRRRLAGGNGDGDGGDQSTPGGDPSSAPSGSGGGGGGGGGGGASKTGSAASAAPPPPAAPAAPAAPGVTQPEACQCGAPPLCAYLCLNGDECKVPDDCRSGDCAEIPVDFPVKFVAKEGSKVCQDKALAAGQTAETICSDDEWDETQERDKNCGGVCTGEGKRCEDTKTCWDDDDCDNRVCDFSNRTLKYGTCVSCNDNVMNNEETDVDCGGFKCRESGKICDLGKKCVIDTDCKSGACIDNTSGVLTTGVCADKQGPYARCNSHADCKSNACMPLINIQQQAMEGNTVSPEDNVCAPDCLSTAEVYEQECGSLRSSSCLGRPRGTAKSFVVKSFPLNITKDGKPLFTQNFQKPTPR